MNLKEITNKRPNCFTYKNEEFTMTHYGKKATHNDMVSDEIIWNGNKGTTINYYKGKVEVEK